MNNILVREAVAYGLDRAGVVNAFYGGRGQQTNQFLPPQLFGYAKTGVPSYPYNPDKAKALLQQAGLTLPVHDRLLVPDERLAAVHARSGSELPGVPGEPREVGLQGHPAQRAVAPGLPRRRCRAAEAQLFLLGLDG